MSSYAGKFLRVNLTRGECKTELVPDEVKRKFIGGRGFGIKYLYDEVPPATDPLGPQNKLILLNGPLAGTNAQSVSRWMAVTKSPLTGGFGRAVGGADFGAWLKFAGFDFIIIEGKAQKPAYLYIANNSCEIRDAADLWGQTTEETQQKLRQKHGERIRMACIGPAGEKLVRYAVIASERRTASRCGVGTVMGSKNLKAVAINAERHLEVTDPASFSELVKEQIKSMQADTGYQRFRDWGTTAVSGAFNALGVFPVRNFRAGQQEGFEKYSGEKYREMRQGEFGCYSCSVRCGKKHVVPSGPYAGAANEGPEYESIWTFTGSIDSTDIGATVAADQLCDDLGIDTISTGNTIGFAYELFEKGIITKKDTDGLELTYGNHAAMITLIGKIGRREGFGDLLAEGSMRAAARIGKGAQDYAMHVKGLELAAYEPRAAKAHGLNFATSNIGASHCYGYARQEIFGSTKPRAVDRFADDHKGDITAYNQNHTALAEVGIACTFASAWEWFSPLFSKMLSAATGIAEFGDAKYTEMVAERIYNLERVFNLREGFGRKDDTLPKRMLTEPLEQKGGPAHGQIVRKQDTLLDEYYQSRGWTREGIPTPQKLKALGLDAVVKDIEKLL